MTGAKIKETTKKREAYFLDFAEKIRQKVSCPLVVTGGFRTGRGMAQAVRSGSVDMVGLARPLAVDPYLPLRILREGDYKSPIKTLTTGLKSVDKISMIDLTWYQHQMTRMGERRSPDLHLSAWRSFLMTLWKNGLQIFQMKFRS